MKQFVKKKVSFVMVMIMAVITVISMSLPMAVFAQGGGYTLTLKNEGSTPHTFQIYQIFSGDLDESKTLSNIQWGTGIKEASKETLGTYTRVSCIISGQKRDNKITGRNNKLQNTVFRKSTGITAFPSNAIFLKTSYIPKRVAEIKANVSHISINHSKA